VTLNEALAEIERLQVAGQTLLSALWEQEYGADYTICQSEVEEARAVFFPKNKSGK
jgi:hypothetical protein